jgi:hypothetical protein
MIAAASILEDVRKACGPLKTVVPQWISRSLCRVSSVTALLDHNIWLHPPFLLLSLDIA